MVGHAALDRKVGVRVPVPEPFFSFLNKCKLERELYKKRFKQSNYANFAIELTGRKKQAQKRKNLDIQFNILITKA